jgi:hypothetical protein
VAPVLRDCGLRGFDSCRRPAPPNFHKYIRPVERTEISLRRTVQPSYPRAVREWHAVTDREQQELEVWRAALVSDLDSPDVASSTSALLALTYDDPDRRAVEIILLRLLTPEVDHQLRALAVTCMGHLGRIHHAVSPDVVHRLKGLLNDPVLCGRADDALDDIGSFAGAALQ